MRDRYAEFTHKPFRREAQSDLPAQLVGNAIDEAGSETAAGWLLNRWAAFFGPRQLEPLRFFIGPRCNLDMPGYVGQRAILHSVCAQLIERHCERQDRA